MLGTPPSTNSILCNRIKGGKNHQKSNLFFFFLGNNTQMVPNQLVCNRDFIIVCY